MTLTDKEFFTKAREQEMGIYKVKPMIVPMKKIEHSQTFRATPMLVTEEYRKEYYRKRAKRKTDELRRKKMKYIELLKLRDQCRKKLSTIDPFKKQSKVAKINFTIDEVNQELTILEKDIGISIDKMDKGTKLERIVYHATESIKNTAKSIGRGITKFFNKHGDTIKAVASVIGPIIITCIFKKWIGV